MQPVRTPQERDKIIDQILKAVRRGKTFFLSGHEKPDGDTVGSELAFASFLRRLNKKVDIYNAESIPRTLEFLPGTRRAKVSKKVEKSYDVAVIFECSGPDRMGNIIDLDSQVKTVINIDHHAHHNHFGHINLINPKASSNSEQLYYVFKRAKMPITREEAAALYVGLITDTGRFQQENANSDSHLVAAELLKTGISVADLSRRVYDTRTESSLKLLGRALSSLRLVLDDRVSIVNIWRRDFEETGSNSEETEDIINYGLSLPSVQVALLFREMEEPGRVKVSLRGKGLVDLCRIAVDFGGGGHKNASGCTVSAPLKDIERKVLAEVEKALPSRPLKARA
jgi:phosphoesterase RecJ-like protein